MSIEQEIAGSMLIHLMKYLEHSGMDSETLLRECGIDPRTTADPDGRIPLEDYIRLEHMAALKSEDPFFGLHVGEFFEMGTYGIVSYLMMNSNNLSEALAKGDVYRRLIGSAISTKVKITFRSVKLIYYASALAPSLSFHCYDSMMVNLITLVRKLTGKHLTPLLVGLCRPVPTDPGEYLRVYGCPVLFSQSKNYLEINPSLGKTPIIHPNEHLSRSFEELARESLAFIDGGTAFSRETARCIVNHLQTPDLSISIVSKKLGIGTRTLQSHLSSEGTNFRDLLRETRIQIAKNQIKHGLTVSEIAYLLGYSDLSAFSKAFKDWTGLSPREYRNAPTDSVSTKI